MALVKVRNDADDGWIEIGGQVSIVQSDAAPGTTFPGMLWLDTNAVGPGVPLIKDNDGDTKINCEESGDEDIIRMDTAGNEVWTMSAAGERIMAYQPSFLAYMSADMDNYARITWHTLEFDTVEYNIGSHYNTDTYTFTAPVDGIYHFGASLFMKDCDQSANYYSLQMYFTGRNYATTFDPGQMGGDPARWPMTFTTQGQMDANDTCYVSYYQSGGADQTDIEMGTSTYFYGALLH